MNYTQKERFCISFPRTADGRFAKQGEVFDIVLSISQILYEIRLRKRDFVSPFLGLLVRGL